VYKRQVYGKTNKQSKINFHIEDVKIVSKKAQRLSFGLTVLGSIAMPATLFWIQSPLILSFGYTPKNKAYMNIGVSSSLNTTQNQIQSASVMKNNGGYFRSEEKNIDKNANKFGKLVYRTLKKLNKNKQISSL